MSFSKSNGSVYGLATVPSRVVYVDAANLSTSDCMAKFEALRAQGFIVWSSATPPPAIGDRVAINFNDLGAGVVVGYFHESGFLGVTVFLDAPPAWHAKQHAAGTTHAGRAMCMGREVAPLGVSVPAALLPAIDAVEASRVGVWEFADGVEATRRAGVLCGDSHVVKLPGGFVTLGRDETHVRQVRLVTLPKATQWDREAAVEVGAAIADGNGAHGVALTFAEAIAGEFSALDALLAALLRG